MRALCRDPATAVRVSEAFAVLSSYLQFKGTFFFCSSKLFNVHFSLKSTAALVEQCIPGSTYFLLKEAVEGEDKHALKSVENGEEVC